MAEERDTHPPCGQPLSETLDPALAEDWTVDEVGGCAACYFLAARSKGEPADRMFAVRRKYAVHTHE